MQEEGHDRHELRYLPPPSIRGNPGLETAVTPVSVNISDARGPLQILEDVNTSDALVRHADTPHTSHDDQIGTLKLANIASGNEHLQKMISIVRYAEDATTLADPTTSDLFNEHIGITALLHGWSAVRSTEVLSDRWEQYQQIDESLIPFKDFATRLSVIIAHKIWKAYGEAKIEGPHLAVASRERGRYRQNKFHQLSVLVSQDKDHKPNMKSESAVRPGLCAAMCEDPQGWATDEYFWSQYFQHWRFAWPHELSDAIESSPVTGMLSLNPKFRKRMHDIRYWTFESEFFEKFPGLDGAAVKFEPQLAVYRLHDRNAHHERLIRQSGHDADLRSAIQAYYDSLKALWAANRNARLITC